ncbi:MAG: hypothetical protein ACK5L3_14415 [Oscillospiraceae bacterium]
MEQIKKIWPTIKAYIIAALGGATTGVPQAEYDEMKATAEKNAAAVATAVQATADAKAALSDTQAQLATAQAELAAALAGQNNAELSAALAAAQKEKADLKADMQTIEEVKI